MAFVRCCALWLVVLSASPFTRPFYTFELTELFGDGPCALCAVRSPDAAVSAQADVGGEEARSDQSSVRPVKLSRSETRLMPVVTPKPVDLSQVRTGTVVQLVHAEYLFEPVVAAPILRL